MPIDRRTILCGLGASATLPLIARHARTPTSALILLAGFLTVTAPSQVTPLQFDVASVKAVQPGNLAPGRITADPGRLRAQSVSIGALAAYAYDLQPGQIVGLNAVPGLYDVEGKADGPHSQAELRAMLQSLLAERFGLKFHRELREMPVARLVAGKDLKLKPAGLTEADPRGFTLRASDRGPGYLKAKASAISLEWLTENLSSHFSELIVDSTGLKGLYEFDVDFEYDRADAADESVPEREAANRIREGLLSALGLKLQPGKKAEVEVIVVDRVERPASN
jgi:uncharacterized protein (TIGR03435 family)